MYFLQSAHLQLSPAVLSGKEPSKEIAVKFNGNIFLGALL